MHLRTCVPLSKQWTPETRRCRTQHCTISKYAIVHACRKENEMKERERERATRENPKERIKCEDGR